MIKTSLINLTILLCICFKLNWASVPWNLFLQTDSEGEVVESPELNELKQTCRDLKQKHGANGQEGIFCHPSESNKMLFCSQGEEAFIIDCPSKYSCRSHGKLKWLKATDDQNTAEGSEVQDEVSTEDMDGEELEESNGWLLSEKAHNLKHAKHNLAQCVRDDQLDLDNYCEDELFSFYSEDAFDKSWNGTKEEEELLASRAQDMNDDYDINNDNGEAIAAVSLCNPFKIARKHLVKCFFVRKKCGLRLDSARCFETREVQMQMEDCQQYEMCRHYRNQDASRKHSAKCHSPLDALCLDRFWSIYSSDFMSSLEETTLTSFLPFTKLSYFKFCDPFRSQKQLECKIEWHVSPLPSLTHQSILAPYEKESMKKYIRDRFPDLYKEVYPVSQGFDDSVLKRRFSIRPLRIEVVHHYCPDQAEFIAERLEFQPEESISDDYDDMEIDGSRYYTTGPVCKQLTRKTSICSPESALRIGIDIVTEEKSDRYGENSPLKLEAFPGFCLGRQPGQFCLPGTPDVGIFCPAGKIIRCRRPAASQISDVDDNTLRCIQKYGDVPKETYAGNPFRNVKIQDLEGNEVFYGAWATCGPQTDQVSQ